MKYNNFDKMVKGLNINGNSIKSLINDVASTIENLSNLRSNYVSDYDVERTEKHHGMYDGHEEEQEIINDNKSHSLANNKPKNTKKKKKSSKKIKTLQFTKSDVVNGLIYSEILGKPKSMKRR